LDLVMKDAHKPSNRQWRTARALVYLDRAGMYILLRGLCWRKNAKSSHKGSRVSIEVYLQRHHERKSTRMVQSESIQAICIPRVHQPFRKINYYDTTFRRSSLVTAHTIEAKLRTCLFSTAHKLSFTTQR
jgi:hypothetical protein